MMLRAFGCYLRGSVPFRISEWSKGTQGSTPCGRVIMFLGASAANVDWVLNG